MKKGTERKERKRYDSNDGQTRRRDVVQSCCEQFILKRYFIKRKNLRSNCLQASAVCGSQTTEPYSTIGQTSVQKMNLNDLWSLNFPTIYLIKL